MFPHACQDKEKKNLLEKQLRFGIIKKINKNGVTQQKAESSFDGQERAGRRRGAVRFLEFGFPESRSL